MNKKGNEETVYISDNDKLYTVQKKKVFNTKKWLLILILLAIILLPLAESSLIKSLDLKKQQVIVEYVETGDIDYNVYLKPNKYYKEKFLGKGMEYVANIINTINPEFRYEMHATDALNLSYTYKVVGKLVIAKDSDSQPLYTQNFDLVKKDMKNIDSNQLSISENLVIDYDEYNNLVNRYKRDFGLSAYSRLILTMDINITGTSKNNDTPMILNRTLQTSIPLSEQTIRVSIDTDKINNNGLLFTKGKITVSSPILFVVSLFSLVLVVLLLITAIKLYIKFKKRNIYYITLGKYIDEYDKLIINGSFEHTDIDENKFDNIIKIEKFEELVDAAENLSLPILFYEVIPGELSFFDISNGNTLYKFTLDKAKLTKKAKDDESNSSKDTKKKSSK